jgi:hypothetical protein
MMVDRISSGTYCARMDIIDGQKTPTHTSNRQNASSWTMPSVVIPARSHKPQITRQDVERDLKAAQNGRQGMVTRLFEARVMPGAFLLRLSVSSLRVRWYNTGTNRAAADTINTSCMYFSGLNLSSEQ